MPTNMDKFSTQCIDDRLVRLVAKAAILCTDPMAMNWPRKFMDEQIELIVNNTCDSRAHESTRVAHLKYQNMIKA